MASKEVLSHPDANETKEVDFMLGTYERGKSINKTSKAVSATAFSLSEYLLYHKYLYSLPDLSHHDTNHQVAIKPPSTYSYKWEDVVWRNVIAFIYLHVSSFYGMYLIATGQVKLSTFIFGELHKRFAH